MVLRSDRSPVRAAKICSLFKRVASILTFFLTKNFALLTLYLGTDRNLLPPRGLSVMAGGGLAVVRPLAFSAIRRFSGRRAIGTVMDFHLVIPHARVNGITLVSHNRFLGTMALYCFRDVSSEPNLASFFVYRITTHIELCLNARGVPRFTVVLLAPSYEFHCSYHMSLFFEKGPFWHA